SRLFFRVPAFAEFISRRRVRVSKSRRSKLSPPGNGRPITMATHTWSAATHSGGSLTIFGRRTTGCEASDIFIRCFIAAGLGADGRKGKNRAGMRTMSPGAGEDATGHADGTRARNRGGLRHPARPSEADVS